MAPPTEPCFANGALTEVCFANGAPPAEHCLGSGALPTEICYGNGVSQGLCKTKVESVDGVHADKASATPALDLQSAKAACNGAGGVAAEQWTSAFEWTLDFPLARVWDLTHNFVGISKWLPTYMRESALVEGTPQQPGCVRSVVGYQDEIPPAYDQLLEMDEHNHKFKYRILTCHLPLLMGHSPTFHFLAASPTSTILKFSSERPPVPNFDEQSYRTFVHELYSGFVSDLIATLSTAP